jgi:hypothetical protein
MWSRLPPRLPVRGKFRALYEWLNRLLEAVTAMQMQFPHGIKSSQSAQGVLLEGNFGAGFRLPTGIAVRELSVCLKIDNGDGTFAHEEAFVRGLFSVTYKKNGDGDPVDSEGNELDETTDPPIPDLTDTDVVSGFEIVEEA